jgi:hypothetical protein
MSPNEGALQSAANIAQVGLRDNSQPLNRGAAAAITWGLSQLLTLGVPDFRMFPHTPPRSEMSSIIQPVPRCPWFS